MAIFVDKTSVIDREALRMYVFGTLREYKDRVEGLLHADTHKPFWRDLHALITHQPEEERRQLLMVESQLLELGHFIETWISTAVDTSERLEFFVATKAQEIKSGDQNHDYYWALQIRHDQLVGLVRVLQALVSYMEQWVQKKPHEVLEDPVFLGMTEHSVEKQVYYEAEKVHRERKAITK